jgi:hypothetical protein
MRSLLLTLCFMLICSTGFAAKIVSFGSLTGGTTDSLDSISVSDANGDGSTVDPLETGDRAFGTDSDIFYTYLYDETSTAAESSPAVIVPDDQAGGTGAWIRVPPSVALDELTDVTGAGNTDYLLKDDGDGTYSFVGSLTTVDFVLGDDASTTAGDIGWDNTNTILEIGDGSAILSFTPDGSIPDAIEFVIDGGGSAITTGTKGFLEIPWDCTITKATLLADQTGSIVIDVWVDTYANFSPTDADSITASAPPTLSSARSSQDSTLTGWTTSLTSGNIIGFNVDSASTVERVTLSLTVER